MAKRFGIGRDAIARGWADHNLKLWRVDCFKVSNDTHFEEKLVDVVGLYMNTPARAVVFSFDEKTQCQAMDRTQPSLPMASVPKELAVHVVLDNLLAHSAPEITKWLAHRNRRRWHLHFTL